MLEVPPETVSRWLNGLSIQPRALDNLMRVFFGLASVRDVLTAPRGARGLLAAESGVPYERQSRFPFGRQSRQGGAFLGRSLPKMSTAMARKDRPYGQRSSPTATSLHDMAVG